MLETIVTEKYAMRQSPIPASPTPPPKSNVINTNQKLKERLASSLKSPRSMVENAVPIAAPALPEPTPPPLGAVANGHGDQAAPAKNLEDGNPGFKQVDRDGKAEIADHAPQGSSFDGQANTSG